jgi:hypothetical protein
MFYFRKEGMNIYNGINIYRDDIRSRGVVFSLFGLQLWIRYSVNFQKWKINFRNVIN